MSLYLPHRYDILRDVEPLTRFLKPRQIARWQRDTALWRDTGARGTPLPKPLEGLLSAISTAQKILLLMGNRAAVVTWSSYVSGTIQPVGWWSMRATSGTNEPNRGSGGAALDMTITSATLGQTGQLGANEAALMDGANSRYQTPNNALTAALTTWEWIFLVNPSNSGESNVGKFASYGTGVNELLIQFNAAACAVVFMRTANTAPANFATTTTAGLTPATWSLLFASYDNVGDRKGHIFKGISGAVSEFSYSAQAPLTGTYKTPTNALNLWNTSDQSGTFAGLGDEAMVVNGNLATATTRTQLAVLSGV